MSASLAAAVVPSVQVDPFKRPPFVEERVSQLEFIGMLKGRVSKEYMPDADTCAGLFDKPIDVIGHSLEVKTRNNTLHRFDPESFAIPNLNPLAEKSGYYQLMDKPEEGVFYMVLVCDHQIITNLKTCRSAVRLYGNNFPLEQTFREWADDASVPHSQKLLLSLNRLALHRQFLVSI
jgi:hypothetical protein